MAEGLSWNRVLHGIACLYSKSSTNGPKSPAACLVRDTLPLRAADRHSRYMVLSMRPFTIGLADTHRHREGCYRGKGRIQTEGNIPRGLSESTASAQCLFRIGWSTRRLQTRSEATSRCLLNPMHTLPQGTQFSFFVALLNRHMRLNLARQILPSYLFPNQPLARSAVRLLQWIDHRHASVALSPL